MCDIDIRNTCYAVHVGNMSNLQGSLIAKSWYRNIADAVYDHQDHFVRQAGCFSRHIERSLHTDWLRTAKVEFK